MQMAEANDKGFDDFIEFMIMDKLFGVGSARFSVVIPIQDLPKILAYDSIAKIIIPRNCVCHEHATGPSMQDSEVTLYKGNRASITIYDAINALVDSKYDPGDECIHRFLSGFDTKEVGPLDVPILVAKFVE